MQCHLPVELGATVCSAACISAALKRGEGRAPTLAAAAGVGEPATHRPAMLTACPVRRLRAACQAAWLPASTSTSTLCPSGVCTASSLQQGPRGGRGHHARVRKGGGGARGAVEADPGHPASHAYLCGLFRRQSTSRTIARPAAGAAEASGTTLLCSLALAAVRGPGGSPSHQILWRRAVRGLQAGCDRRPRHCVPQPRPAAPLR